MAGLTIGWEYLTGYAVATDPTDRWRPEWPPHPGRVFLAMAAAWYETPPAEGSSGEAGQQHEAEGQALRWLETLGRPQLYLAPAEFVNERTNVTAYVPVNDKAGPASATLQSVPALTRRKQPRAFPRLFFGAAPCFLHWPDADGFVEHRDALDRLCGKVTRIGHSSSLVRMWVAEDGEVSAGERWEPADVTAASHCRIVTPGTLDALPAQTQIPRIEAFAELASRIRDAASVAEEAKAAGDKPRQRAANKALKAARTEYEKRFGERWRSSASPPPLLRPKLGLWSGYRRVQATEPDTKAPHTHFDTDLLVLTQVTGPRLPVVATLQVTKAFRGAAMKHGGAQPPPQWVSGHRPDGQRGEREQGHMAIVPLPFVGHAHADGHLLGLAVAFPRDVDRQERGRALGPLLLEKDGQPRDVSLRPGRLGLYVLRKREWNERRSGLEPEAWTAQPHGAATWASVTPVVLDNFPKGDHQDPAQRQQWEEQVRQVIKAACGRIGLPDPVHIDVGTTCWHIGSPRAVIKARPLRGQHSIEPDSAATLGDGFPRYPAKGANAPRPQVHVWLRFGEPVFGPVLLGAGRYQGYGLCKPWREGS